MVTNPRADTADHFSGRLEPRFRARHYQITQLLERRVDRSKLIVEIGAGTGALGLLLLHKGFRYVGFEPADGLPDLAVSKGLNVVRNEFRSGLLAEPAGAVVLDNLLEHVLDPAALLREAARAIEPTGKLVIIVPNRLDIRQLYPPWRNRYHYKPPDHINYFRPNDLFRILRSMGFAVSPFGLTATTLPRDMRYLPRAMAELVRLFPFALNVIAERPS